MAHRLQREDYTVGWICAPPIELHVAMAQEMLDGAHDDLKRNECDDTLYFLESIAGHNVVIAYLPAGGTGISPVIL
jgi:hypothetical protein